VNNIPTKKRERERDWDYAKCSGLPRWWETHLS